MNNPEKIYSNRTAETIDSELSNAGRLHSLFVSIEVMTREEYKNQGENLEIHFSFAEGPFGKMLVASTQKGICFLGLANDETRAMEYLQKNFPKAVCKQKKEASHQEALSIFTENRDQSGQIKLHLKGTEFQIAVWNALLKIPMGHLCSYGDIARQIGHQKAFRAVGSAVGDNPVFFLIPCHRVIQASGKLGNYYWGAPVKAAIIEWESAIRDTFSQ